MPVGMSDENRDHLLVGFGSAVDNTLHQNYWQKRYDIDYISWHQPAGNERMQNVLERVLTEELAGKKPEDIKVLVPLCGKSKDNYRMYRRGFTVVGVDWTRKPVEDFFSENSIETDPNSASPYVRSKDGRVIIGVGDWFTFGNSSESENQLPFDKYDIIWDRGCFDSINVNLREKYAAKIVSLLSPGGVYILDSKVFDTKGYKGPPLPLSEADIQKYYGADLSVETRERGQWVHHCGHDVTSHWKGRDITDMEQFVYVLKHKKD